MKVSVFTPTHDPRWLADAYHSLQEQTYPDWEWVLVPNGGVAIPPEISGDPRVKVYPLDMHIGRVGALKYYACSKAQGEILVELDHDDRLTPDCLAEVVRAFQENPGATMVYSNDAQFHDDWLPGPQWSAYYGWQYRPFVYKGYTLLETLSPAPIPQHLSRIWFAPDHVRAWRAVDYWRIGPHNEAMQISDDHDLVSRHYLFGRIVHIDRCLYLYRVHEAQTTWKLNPQIQTTQWENYDRYIWPMAEKWADDRSLLKVDLGSGADPYPGFLSLDAHHPADVQADLNERWPFQDGTVGVIRAFDIVEHLKDPVYTMNEAWRVLAHGGFLMIFVPSTDGRGAFQDPTHISFWNENSFRYYTREDTFRFIVHAARCRYQALKVETHFPNDWARDLNIPYVTAHLIALKGGGRFHGAYDWS
jgi:glycosyltransferase involved in cell wall biosynthesis